MAQVQIYCRPRLTAPVIKRLPFGQLGFGGGSAEPRAMSLKFDLGDSLFPGISDFIEDAVGFRLPLLQQQEFGMHKMNSRWPGFVFFVKPFRFRKISSLPKSLVGHGPRDHGVNSRELSGG